MLLRQLAWGTLYKLALASIQDSLQNLIKPVSRKHDHVLCTYTQASEEFWPAVVTKSREDQLQKKNQRART